MRDIVFWGASGQAKVLYEAIDKRQLRLVALIDNRDVPSPIPGIETLVGERGLDQLLSKYDERSKVLFAIAVGGSNGTDRLQLFDAMKNRGLTPHTIIHSTAFVASDCSIGPGCQLLAMCAVCAGARLGRSTIVNTAASVDHDCQIGDGVHIAPGARLAGEITVGARAFIGAGAIVLPRLRIGDDSVVGAGAVVISNVLPGSRVVGNPARPISR